ncbi:MAG: hypothetical protein COA52_15915 [Hyphomicrobiales bacterium]|nr:MAG: hypothetical protein COA52_15915 [Hyphomicrobiales bacterium]
MSCARIDKLRKPQLFDPSKSLEGSALNNFPSDSFKLIIRIKLDEIMNGVSYTLNCQMFIFCSN